MTRLAIIGGSGLARMEGLELERREMVKTPYGAPSCPLVYGRLDGVDIVFLARHGSSERIPPHRINYCANIWALHSVGIRRIVATSAVGGIGKHCTPGSVVVPDQLIDYTHGRQNSFLDTDTSLPQRRDFTSPYSADLRRPLIDAATRLEGVDVVESGCYAAMQGPRFETAAEVRRLDRDGNTIVGMTGMPEAALARALNIEYACLAVVVNRAAGLGDKDIDLHQIAEVTRTGMKTASAVLAAAAAAAAGSDHGK